MKDIVILGAGGHAHVIADIIKAEGNRVIAFLDDDLSQKDCAGPISTFVKFQNCEFVIGIGNTEVRKRISKLNLNWHTAVHPTAVISDSSIIGEGTVVMPNVVINARTIIGNHCIINTGSIVEHDNNIGDYTHISVGANLGGTVSIGNSCWIGIGATLKNDINVCDNVILGAGSVVIDNIVNSGTYVGVPARIIRND